MAAISILGVFTLLGLCWALSFHKKKVKLPPIAWGIGLQLLFALIILSQKLSYSIAGLSILALLISTFIMQSEVVKWGGKVKGTIISVVLFIVTGIILYFPYANLSCTKYLPWIFVLFLFLNGIFKWCSKTQRIVAALLVISVVDILLVNEISGQMIFQILSKKVAYFLTLSDYGAKFLFGNLADGKFYFTGPNAGWPGFGFQFAFKVLPTIIFFGGFMSVLYYLKIMQKVIEAISKFMRWTIGTSGAETLSCSANIFVGQTEAPLLIKPFVEQMTVSELTTIMIGGFATIAGGVMAGYIAMGIPAGHIIAASAMAAPAALVIGKIIFPETEHSQTAGDTKLPDISVGGNVIEAASNGISDGAKLAMNVGFMLIGFISLIAVVDLILNSLDSLIDGNLLSGAYYKYKSIGLSPAEGEYAGFFPGSLQTLFGTLLRPLAFLMGVPWADSAQIGNLLGIKLSLNEFIAYGTLSDYIQAKTISPRSIIIATYALCGFANFSSIGIQIGGISAIAPSRKSDLARVGLRAMLGGAIASALNGTIAGIFL